MSYGEVLARSAQQERAMKQLSGAERGKNRRLLRRSFVLSWATLFVSIAFLVIIAEEQMSGAHALAFLLLMLLAVLSLLMSVVVTSYIFLRSITGLVTKLRTRDEQPQPAVPTTALNSVSVLQLVLPTLLGFAGVIAAGVKYGGTGILVALALGLLSIFVLAREFNVMSQRVEVTADQVDFTLVGRTRTVKAADIVDIETHWSSFPQRVTHITFHIRAGSPVILAGNFVSDTDLAVVFIDEARLLLGLDEPADQPLPPSPQDAQR